MGGRLMKFGKHTAFMIEFISDFVNGEIERLFFDLDYSHYVIKHFPYMENENERIARKFADTIDVAYERWTDTDISDEAFREKISVALKEWLQGQT